MLEEVLVTARYNHKIDPVLGIWSWEIPTYLFLGGLTAGIMFFAAALVLSLLATVYPAWRAARVAPAEVLRYE